MERPRKKVKLSDEIQGDMLSNLPDPIIHHILSLMITKDAVRTCVLSKNWRYHWTNIHTLSFCRSSFTNNHVFCDFITNVLHRRNHLKLLKLKLYCWKNSIRHKIISLVSEYAISHGFEELETDTDFPVTLKLCLNFNYSSFATLTTLQLYRVWFRTENHTFAGCLNLQNLQLIHCDFCKVYTISAPRLLTLQISDDKYFGGKIVINAPRLKFFNLNATDPLLLSMDGCPSLDKVNIQLSPFTAYNDDSPMMAHYKQQYVSSLRMIAMRQGISHVKSFTLSLNLSHQRKIILYHNILAANETKAVNAETKVVELDKETQKEKLVFALPMNEDFDLNQLGNAVVEIALEELSNLRTRLLKEKRTIPSTHGKCIGYLGGKLVRIG